MFCCCSSALRSRFSCIPAVAAAATTLTAVVADGFTPSQPMKCVPEAIAAQVAGMAAVHG